MPNPEIDTLVNALHVGIADLVLPDCEDERDYFERMDAMTEARAALSAGIERLTSERDEALALVREEFERMHDPDMVVPCRCPSDRERDRWCWYCRAEAILPEEMLPE